MFLNVSSGVDAHPNKYSSIYSATKAYLSNLMKTITLELNSVTKKDQNQDINMYFLNLSPLYIRTKMIRYLKEWDVVEP
jgi:short-subunit dehydrogenase